MSTEANIQFIKLEPISEHSGNNISETTQQTSERNSAKDIREEHNYFYNKNLVEMQKFQKQKETVKDPPVRLPLQSYLLIKAHSSIVLENVNKVSVSIVQNETQETSSLIEIIREETDYAQTSDKQRRNKIRDLDYLPEPKARKRRRKFLGNGLNMCPQAKELIYNVFNYFNFEKQMHRPLIPVDSVHEKLSAATGLNVNVISDILNNTNIVPEKKKKKKLDSEELTKGQESCTVTTTKEKNVTLQNNQLRFNNYQSSLNVLMNKLYRENNKEITVESFLERLKESNFDYSMTQLWKKLKRVGYFYRKSGNKLLIYKNKRLVDWQLNYIRQMKTIRQSSSNNRPIFYVDETWFGPNYNNNQTWFKIMNPKGTVPRPGTVKTSERVFVAQVGNENGFVQDAGHVYIPKRKVNEWNGEQFEKWFKTKVLTHLPKNSFIILNNARWHCRQLDKCPLNCARKNDMIKWLKKEKVSFDATVDKKTLYEKYIVPNKNKRSVKYIIDRMAAKCGCTIVRLPPLHGELNPFNEIWPMVKNRAMKKTLSLSFNTKDFMQNISNEFANFSSDDWKLAVEKVIETEKLYYPDLEAGGNFFKLLVVLLSNNNKIEDCVEKNDSDVINETCNNDSFNSDDLSNVDFKMNDYSNIFIKSEAV